MMQPPGPASRQLVDTIASNLTRIRERIDAACRRAGRSSEEVTVIGVTKGFPLAVVLAAVEAGLRDLGENRVQEATDKVQAATAMDVRPRWHLVGHLQTNKVQTALGLFDIIHSVDSLRLAEAVSRRADAPVPVLIEVNVGGEESKYGLRPEETPEAVERIRSLLNLDVRGLMTVAPLGDDPEQARPVFRRLRELGQRLGLPELSMGMSDDFEVAMEEGATLVRIGRALFGERPDPFERSKPALA